MVVGVCRVTLMLAESHSLKEKRMALRRIKDRVQNKFNCAVAEVGDQDAWQAAALGFAVVSNDHGFTQSMVQKILAYIEELAVAKIVDDEQDYVHYGDELDSSGGHAHWEPDEPSPMAAPEARRRGAVPRPPAPPPIEATYPGADGPDDEQGE